jgi:FPC/CPF motif-containing protein YcgG
MKSMVWKNLKSFKVFANLPVSKSKASLLFCSTDNPEFEFCIATAKILIECAAEDSSYANVSFFLIVY